MLLLGPGRLAGRHCRAARLGMASYKRSCKPLADWQHLITKRRHKCSCGLVYLYCFFYGLALSFCCVLP
jgi:hypothetical protein